MDRNGGTNLVPGPGESVAEPEDVAALAAYQARMKACTRCVGAGFLAEAHPVFQGHAAQRLMIVGQAPGARGHASGVPWSGPSGRIIAGWLTMAGFDVEEWRSGWYLTSLTKCFPGKAAQGKGDRAPSPAEIALCADHLATELALVRPEIIVTLGKMSAVRLIPGAGRMSLADLVGEIFAVDVGYGEIGIVPLPHPSGVSRWLNDPANRVRVQVALGRLGEERAKRGL